MPPLDIDEYARRAAQRFRYGDNTGAVNIICEGLAQEPDSGFLHSYLALGLLRQRRVAAAQHEATLGLSLEPAAPFSHFCQAQVHQARGHFRKALPHLEQAVAAAPLNEDYQLALAQCLMALGRGGAARAHLDVALAHAPENPELLAALGDWHMAHREYAQAREFFVEALQLEPQHSHTLVAMGHLALREGDLETAREHAIWVLQQDAGDAGGLRLMSAIKARRNPFIGLWWRANSWLSIGGNMRIILVLTMMYLLVQAGIITLKQNGQPGMAEILGYVWLGIVIYSWVGPVYFNRKIQAELENVELKREF